MGIALRSGVVAISCHLLWDVDENIDKILFEVGQFVDNCSVQFGCKHLILGIDANTTLCTDMHGISGSFCLPPRISHTIQMRAKLLELFTAFNLLAVNTFSSKDSSDSWIWQRDKNEDDRSTFDYIGLSHGNRGTCTIIGDDLAGRGKADHRPLYSTIELPDEYKLPVLFL